MTITFGDLKRKVNQIREKYGYDDMDQFPISILIGTAEGGIKDVDFYYDDINEGQASHVRIVANVESVSLDRRRD